MSKERPYLRLFTSDVWHFHPRCHHMITNLKLVTHVCHVKYGKPKSGEFCNECLAKERKDLKR